MPSQFVRCPCGHQWEWLLAVPPPEDLRTICPICSSTHHGGGSPPNPPDSSATSIGTERPEDVLRPLFPGFEVIEEINRGGMGVVFKARQIGLNRIVALKVISPERLKHPEAMNRFQREVRAAALLSDPHIVTVFHTDLHGPYPYLAMEFVDGIDLATLVYRSGPLTSEDALYYTRQAAQGLQHAHEKGMVHRDIKPANIMVTPSPLDSAVRRGVSSRGPTVKILDMGLARMEKTVDEVETNNLTHAGEFLGTPDYIAPEQAEDPRNVDIRTDLYSLGATLYYLLTAEVPFPGGSLIQKLRRQLTEPPPSPSKKRSELTAGVDGLVYRLMAKSPADRFQTPTELIDAIDQVLRGGTPSMMPRSSAPATSTQSRASLVYAHANGVQSMSISPDGQYLLTGGLDEAIRLWDARGLREVRCFTQDAGPVNEVALAPSGRWAASCATRLFPEDMVVNLYDVTTGSERRRLRGHTKNVTCLAIGPKSRMIASGSEDQSVRIWTLDVQGEPRVLAGHTATVTALAFLPGGSGLVSASLDGTVRSWDVLTGEGLGQFFAKAGRLLCVAFGILGNRLAVGGDGPSNLRLRQPDGNFINLHGHRGPVSCVSFSLDGQLLVSGGHDRTLCVWRVDNGEQIARFEGHTGLVTSAAFAPDFKTLYSASGDGTVRRWHLG